MNLSASQPAGDDAFRHRPGPNCVDLDPNPRWRQERKKNKAATQSQLARIEQLIGELFKRFEELMSRVEQLESKLSG